MSTIVEKGFGVGDVISLLWFKRSLPSYCTRFIEVRSRGETYFLMPSYCTWFIEVMLDVLSIGIEHFQLVLFYYTIYFKVIVNYGRRVCLLVYLSAGLFVC